jgi:hypothetical protein
MANNSDSIGALTLHAEVIGLLISKNPIPVNIENYLLRVIHALERREGNERQKKQIKALLESL